MSKIPIDQKAFFGFRMYLPLKFIHPLLVYRNFVPLLSKLSYQPVGNVSGSPYLCSWQKPWFVISYRNTSNSFLGFQLVAPQILIKSTQHSDQPKGNHKSQIAVSKNFHENLSVGFVNKSDLGIRCCCHVAICFTAACALCTIIYCAQSSNIQKSFLPDFGNLRDIL